jgi:hypothetical protein
MTVLDLPVILWYLKKKAVLMPWQASGQPHLLLQFSLLGFPSFF